MYPQRLPLIFQELAKIVSTLQFFSYTIHQIRYSKVVAVVVVSVESVVVAAAGVVVVVVVEINY